jgi:hypothetical protein
MNEFVNEQTCLKKEIKASLLKCNVRSVRVCHQWIVTKEILPSSNSLIFKF